MKLAFIDVDGTLLNYSNIMPKSAEIAIKKAQDAGNQVYIVTGRSKGEMYEEILSLGTDGYIGVNGNYIEVGNEAIYHNKLNMADVNIILDWIHERNLDYYIESNSGLYANKDFRVNGVDTIKAYRSYKGDFDTSEVTVESIFPEMIFGTEDFPDDVNKISFILSDYQDYLDAKEKFSKFHVSTWGGDGERALFGDVGPEGVDKATGIKRLLEHLKIESVETFAFGDAKVDIPMLEYCDVGIAMGSGGSEIKEMADYVTDTVDNDGLYKAFQHFELF